MNITLNIEAENPAELQEAITGLAGITGGSVTAAPESKPKKEAKKPKPEKKPDPEPAKPETADEESSDPENVPTDVELRAKAQEVGKTPEKKKAIKALLDKYECSNLTALPDGKRAAFMAELAKI